MKKILTLICTLLCANVLLAQTRFFVGDLQYEVTSTNPAEVMVYWYQNNPTTANIPATVTYQGTTYSVTSIDAGAFHSCSSLTSVTIPNSVTSIGERAFAVCSSLTSVTIPNSVTSIGERAFVNCSSLTSITIPNSVTSIGGGVFGNCSSLTSVTLSNNITELPLFSYLYSNGYSYCGFFENCWSLTSVTIPNSVTSIGEMAFVNCSSLTSITIPNSVTSIGEAAFGYCSSLTSITIPNSVTSIGVAAFYGCSSLTSMTVDMTYIPNLSYIGLNSTLQNLTIGENVTSIASGAFNSYSFLQNITCLATTPPTLADNTVFPYPNIATLTVPCGTLEAYSSATSFWNMFFMGRISEDGYEVVANVNNDAFGSVAIENNCSTATLTATANACYQFVGWNDGNTENPRIVTLSSDTTLTANFEVMVVNNDITATICEGQVYTENNFNVSEAGIYTQNLTSVNGCDSIVTLTVSVNPVFDTTINATINAGETYAEFGFNESEAGTYVQNLQSINGCDSTITLVLSVNSSLYDVAEFAELSVYPNPTRGKVTFSQAIEKIEVIDLSGKTLQTYENANEINIEALPAGVYHLRMTIEDKTTTRKVIKE